MVTESEKASAILNIRRTITLSDSRTLKMRRHRMSEVLEHLSTLGNVLSEVVSRYPSGSKVSTMLPGIIGGLGAPAFGILAQVTERSDNGDGVEVAMMPGEIGDLDVEDFATLLLTYTQMHEKAIETFQVAFNAMQGKGKGEAGKASNGSSIGSSERVTPLRPSLTPPSTES